MTIVQKSRESDCTFPLLLSRSFPKWMFLLAFILATAIPSLAGAAILSTDQPEYAPGDSVIIYGSGFWSGETVTVQVTHDDGTPPGGLGHDPWNVVADAGGDFETYWIVPSDDNVDEVLRVTATGQSSGDQATTTFLDANTILTLEPYPDSLCPNTGGDSLDVCAVLEEQCGGSGFAPLEGRPLIFFFNDGNCGVDW